MCGIFGLIERRGVAPALLANMSRLLRHRGPDGEGFVLLDPQRRTALPLGGPQTPADAFALGTASAPRRRIVEVPAPRNDSIGIGLGHRRLAIVDLSSHGHQPMAATDGATWICFNGEIYNHIELRAELEAEGVRFESHSDTEVILAAYRRWGVECLQRFNGMWAFVLFDMHSGRLFIARDRFGVKPLYFWRDGETFAFASEIKAFLAHPRFSPTPAVERLRSYLRDGPSEFLGNTVFENVFRLMPSCYIEATPQDLLSGNFQQLRWWKLQPSDHMVQFDNTTADRLATEYLQLLDSAVELRLRADVTVGSALSGGLDSSSVVYLAAGQIRRQGSQRKQETFSSVYRSKGTEHCDESQFIEEVGKRLDVRLNTIEPDPRDIPTEHSRMVWCMDSPPESTLMSSWHTFRLVNSRGIKVTLDGQGADEQLAGYLTYLPIHLARLGLRAARELPSMLAVHPPRVAFGATVAGLAARVASHPAVAGRVPGRRGHVLRQLNGGLNAALAQDAFTGLANLIHYADRTSMAFGVESRMPFLDYRLAEFLAQVPPAYKIHQGWTKYLARRAFSDKLPDSVVWRKDKMGWPIPELTWEQGSLASWFASAASSQRAMDDLGLGQEFADARTSRHITSRVRALNMSAWTRTFLGGGWRAFQ